MKKNSIVLAAICVAIGLVILGFFISKGLQDMKNADRSVQVKGLSEIQVSADRVIWPIVYIELGNDLQEIYRTIESKNKTVMDFLAAGGVEASEVIQATPIIVDNQANQYGNQKAAFRYNVTSVLTVSSEKVEPVRELMRKQIGLLKNGITITGEDYRYQTQFLFTKLNEVKPKMIEEATKNARLSAEKFAEDSDSRLGKIRKAYQGQLDISNRDAYTPHIKNLRVVTTIDYQLKD